MPTSPVPAMRLAVGKSRKFAKKRRQLRDELWPGSSEIVWSRDSEKGYTTVPRTLPLVARLIRELAPKKSGNPSGVYLDLWFRGFDEGFLEIQDPEECAYAAGYSGTRALRSWRDNIRVLEQLGFIQVAAAGNRDIAYVLVVHPHLAVRRLRESGNRVGNDWWNEFVARCQKIGATIPALDTGAAAAS